MSKFGDTFDMFVSIIEIMVRAVTEALVPKEAFSAGFDSKYIDGIVRPLNEREIAKGVRERVKGIADEIMMAFLMAVDLGNGCIVAVLGEEWVFAEGFFERVVNCRLWMIGGKVRHE